MFNAPSAEQTADDAAKQQTLDTAIAAFVNNPATWSYEKCADYGTPQTPLSAERQEDLKSAVSSIMHKFADGFLLRNKLAAVYKGAGSTADAEDINTSPGGKAEPSRTMYRSEPMSGELVDLYLNMITNESLSRLKSFGLTDKQSYNSCKHIVSGTIKILYEKLNIRAGGLRPKDVTQFAPEEHIDRVTAERIERVQAYAGEKIKTLTSGHEKEKLDKKYR